MLLHSVIIVLREVIEAAILIGILLAFGNKMQLGWKWLMIATVTGLTCATVYASHITQVSAWYEGVGQEIVNAGLQLAIYGLLLVFVMLTFYVRKGAGREAIKVVMAVMMIVAMMREGSEILLYLRGFRYHPEMLQSAVLGGLIGAGIGMSVGVLLYYVLTLIPRRAGITTGFVLCLLIAGGMVLQAIQLLAQADIIDSQYPLWDTSAWVSERSLTGQILYALFSYEATPTPTQVFAYAMAIVVMIVAALLARSCAMRRGKK